MKNNPPNLSCNENGLPKRVDKTLAWLADSRNKWKEKCMEAKLQLKRQTFAIKRVKDSRDDWKLRNIKLKQQSIENELKIAVLQRRVDELECQIQDQKREIHELKKNADQQHTFEIQKTFLSNIYGSFNDEIETVSLYALSKSFLCNENTCHRREN